MGKASAASIVMMLVSEVPCIFRRWEEFTGRRAELVQNRKAA